MQDEFGISAEIGHRYVLIGPLGRGAMGSVYKVRDRLTKEFVALKRVEVHPLPLGSTMTQGPTGDFTPAGNSGTGSLPISLSHSPSQEVLRLYRLALAQEFRTLATLRHPNIVSVLDYGFWEGQPYFTMELLAQCQTLREAAAELPLPKKVHLLAEVLRALSYLHRRGILHRDNRDSNYVGKLIS